MVFFFLCWVSLELFKQVSCDFFITLLFFKLNIEITAHVAVASLPICIVCVVLVFDCGLLARCTWHRSKHGLWSVNDGVGALLSQLSHLETCLGSQTKWSFWHVILWFGSISVFLELARGLVAIGLLNLRILRSVWLIAYDRSWTCDTLEILDLLVTSRLNVWATWDFGWEDIGNWRVLCIAWELDSRNYGLHRVWLMYFLDFLRCIRWCLIQVLVLYDLNSHFVFILFFLVLADHDGWIWLRLKGDGLA